LRWVHDNRNALGISTLTLAGESGGGNLSLATTLKAKRDGCIQMIDGVSAFVPYISGMYGRPKSELLSELPSLVENDGYFMSCADSDVNACVYDPGGEHATDPLCWPYHATVDELAGLPPHLISVNELDPVRDEGVAYYSKLKRAGVAASLRTVPGACHAADMMLPAHMPDAYQATDDRCRSPRSPYMHGGLCRGGRQDLDNRVQRLLGRRSVADVRVGKFQDEEQVGG
jgi:acetyl esterase/lipase